ncbi:hypothetical protein BKA70DRAFT_1240661 [Coprinopsis sp. MPI-PUGE-AT-0042]|nr:hypothetical protein BKA70DRAFT_1240661 [Coprinopsis sp. MPI-PUGE-AT-0042]
MSDFWGKLPRETRLQVLAGMNIQELDALRDDPIVNHDAGQVLSDRVALELIKWGLPAAETLRRLKETGSVISGSFALKAVLASSFTPGDIDIYCPKGRSEEVFLFLKDNGYEDETRCQRNFANNSTISVEGQFGAHYDGLDTAIEQIYLLIHPGTGKKINVICSFLSSALIPILLFHSTLLMNWISQDGIACLYPGLTLRKRGLQNEFPARSKTKEALLKYRERGFQIVSEWDDLDESELVSTTGWGQVRTLGDSGMLFVPICEGDTTSRCASFQGIKWRLAEPEGLYAGDESCLQLRDVCRPEAWIISQMGPCY